MVTIKVIAVMALWAACFPLITVGLDRAPHITFAAMRALIAGVALTSAAIVLGRPVPKGRTTWLLLGVAGGGATTLGFLGMFHAAEYIAPGMATVIANTQPLLAAALAFMVLNERLGTSGIVGLASGKAFFPSVEAAQSIRLLATCRPCRRHSNPRRFPECVRLLATTPLGAPISPLCGTS